MLRIADSIMSGLAKALHAAATIFLVLMFLLINVEVTLRYLFNRSTMISDEYSGYFFCWLIMCGVLQVAKQDLHLRIEFGLNSMSPGIRKAAHVFASLVALAVTLLLAKACYTMTAESYRFGSASLQVSETPMWIPQSLMVVGMGLLALHYLEDMLRRLAGYSSQGH